MENLKKKFTDIYHKGSWGCPETVSGGGSALKHTRNYRKELSGILKEYKIKSIFDCPCGDFNFMRKMNLRGIQYIGADIVEELVQDNIKKYETKNIKFRQIDLTRDEVPCCDLVIVKDLLQHLSVEDTQKCFDNIKKSGSKYLLINHNPALEINVEREKVGGGFYNLQEPPFNFGEPLKCIIKDRIHPVGSGKNKPYDYYLWCL